MNQNVDEYPQLKVSFFSPEELVEKSTSSSKGTRGPKGRNIIKNHDSSEYE